MASGPVRAVMTAARTTSSTRVRGSQTGRRNGCGEGASVHTSCLYSEQQIAITVGLTGSNSGVLQQYVRSDAGDREDRELAGEGTVHAPLTKQVEPGRHRLIACRRTAGGRAAAGSKPGGTGGSATPHPRRRPLTGEPAGQGPFLLPRLDSNQ